MSTDTLLKCRGMEILCENLGIVESARFIALMNREPFDYTEWQRNLYADIPLEVLVERADKFQKEHFPNEA